MRQVLKAPLFLSNSVLRYVIENDMTIAYFYSEERLPIFVKPVELANTEFNVCDLQAEVSRQQVTNRNKFTPELYRFIKDGFNVLGVWDKPNNRIPNQLKYVFQLSAPETDLDVEYVTWSDVRPRRIKSVRDLRRIENIRQPINDILIHKYQLRPDFQVTLTLPANITTQEARDLISNLQQYLISEHTNS